jgi:hypothetical protein
MAAIGMTVKN